MLHNAADIIESRGFNIGSLINPKTGNVCAVGAIKIAAGAQPQKIGSVYILLTSTMDIRKFCDMTNALVQHLATIGIDGHIPNWNDTHDAETVIRVMREAAK